MQIGTQIDAYCIDALLGTGTWHHVYKAWHTGLGCSHVLKMLLRNSIADEACVKRFLDEARNLARLQHPNIPAVYAVSDDNASHPYIAIESLDGSTLSDLMKHGPILLAEALPILRQIADGLDYLHEQGLLHPVLIPHNILLKNADAGAGYTVKITNLDTVKKDNDEQPGLFVGPPEYTSPERVLRLPADAFSDQYTLAVIGYEMLCGRPPFVGPLLSVLTQHIHEQPPAPSVCNGILPAGVDAAFMKALAKNPQDRFGSCVLFVETLARETP